MIIFVLNILKILNLQIEAYQEVRQEWMARLKRKGFKGIF